jgi:hypothetical protein
MLGETGSGLRSRTRIYGSRGGVSCSRRVPRKAELREEGELQFARLTLDPSLLLNDSIESGVCYPHND